MASNIKAEKKIAFIPIDNRPVCYDLPEMIVNINGGVQMFLPPIEFLGDLTKNADIEGIYNWLENLEETDYVVLSLDTLAYGGLIPSRRGTETFEEVKERMKKFFSLFEKKGAKILAFSSIMRISNNNVNEEEKAYWSEWGKEIFKYSFNMHKYGSAQTPVPSEILADYLETRKRNFDINRFYLELQKENFFDTLVFSKDDCAQYGFNVEECEKLTEIIINENLNALLKTGADEIPMSLLSRIFSEGKNIKIAPVFTHPESVDLISKYEDISVLESVKGQITLAGCEVCEQNEADIVLLVNNFNKEQGELVMGVDVEGFSGNLELPPKPYLISDILNANGADNSFVEKLFEKDFANDNFLGYAAWNTTGNTLGSAICTALSKYTRIGAKDEKDFLKVQAVRFLDDWAYQGNVRKYLKEHYTEINVEELQKAMIPYEKKVNEKLGTNFFHITYSFPWNRYFEIRCNCNVVV